MNKITELKIITYKVPIQRDENLKEGYKEIESDYTKLKITNQETLELKSMLDLPEQAKLVGQFNTRQLEYLKQDSTKDYILKKIIQK